MILSVTHTSVYLPQANIKGGYKFTFEIRSRGGKRNTRQLIYIEQNLTFVVNALFIISHTAAPPTNNITLSDLSEPLSPTSTTNVTSNSLTSSISLTQQENTSQ